jgi:hypothetical protein
MQASGQLPRSPPNLLRGEASVSNRSDSRAVRERRRRQRVRVARAPARAKRLRGVGRGDHARLRGARRVAKDETSLYQAGPTRGWLKVKQKGWTDAEERWQRRISRAANREFRIARPASSSARRGSVAGPRGRSPDADTLTATPNTPDAALSCDFGARDQMRIVSAARGRWRRFRRSDGVETLRSGRWRPSVDDPRPGALGVCLMRLRLASRAVKLTSRRRMLSWTRAMVPGGWIAND